MEHYIINLHEIPSIFQRSIVHGKEIKNNQKTSINEIQTAIFLMLTKYSHKIIVSVFSVFSEIKKSLKNQNNHIQEP